MLSSSQHFRDEEIENSFIKFRWNLMLEAFKKGMLVMNVAYTLYLGTLTTLYDLMYFLVGLNAPVMMCGFIAWKCKSTDNVEIIKKRKKILTALLTFVNVVQASFGASTSDLSMCIGELEYLGGFGGMGWFCCCYCRPYILSLLLASLSFL